MVRYADNYFSKNKFILRSFGIFVHVHEPQMTFIEWLHDIKEEKRWNDCVEARKSNSWEAMKKYYMEIGSLAKRKDEKICYICKINKYENRFGVCNVCMELGSVNYKNK